MVWDWEASAQGRYLTSQAWKAAGCLAAFSARIGGTSDDPYRSLNLGLHVGDDSMQVLANRQSFARLLGIAFDRLVCGEQVHGTAVAVIDAKDCARGVSELETVVPAVDALITIEPGVYLMAFFADCIPVFLFDPVQKAVGIAHAGWKGTAGRIGAETVRAMQQRFGSVPQDLLAFIGPGIGPECYPVDEQRAALASELFTFHEEIIYSIEGKWRYAWNLKHTNRKILLEAGLAPDRIEVSPDCTCCMPETYFSYRGTGPTTGRMAAVIGVMP
ncbi:MAG: peptidoglycan editing factor PgeF [Solirubrobacterales bacterium]